MDEDDSTCDLAELCQSKLLLLLHLIFGLSDPKVVGTGAEGAEDVLLVLHPRLKLLATVVEAMQVQRLLQLLDL